MRLVQVILLTVTLMIMIVIETQAKLSDSDTWCGGFVILAAKVYTFSE